MKIVTRKTWLLHHADYPGGDDTLRLPPGEYHVEPRRVRIGDKTVTWLCLKGRPWGMARLAWLQWTTHTGEWQVSAYDDLGRPLDQDGNPAEDN